VESEGDVDEFDENKRLNDFFFFFLKKR